MMRALLLAALLGLASPAARAADCDPAFAAGFPQAVDRAAVAAVDAGTDINFWQFCAGREFHDYGNATGVLRTIAANPLLAGPIAEKGWRVDDVKFVRVGNGRIDLWLHRDP